ILALSLIGIAFIFWKMDQRVRYLVKHAEDALKAIEDKWMENEDFIGPALALFRTEEAKTDSIRGLRPWNLWQRHFSYADCFGVVYVVFVVLGLVGVIAAVIKWTGLIKA